MLIIENNLVSKSGVILNNDNILKYIDEIFYVNKNGELKKEITLAEIRGLIISYPSLLSEFRYLNDLVILGGDVEKENQVEDSDDISHMICYTEEIEGKKIDNLNIVSNGQEFSTVFIKIGRLYNMPIRYGIVRKPEDINNIEIMKEISIDMPLSNFLNIINIEMDFMDDDEIDYYIEKMKK